MFRKTGDLLTEELFACQEVLSCMVLVFRRLTAIRGVSGSHPGRDTNYPDRFFVVLSSHSRRIPRYYLTQSTAVSSHVIPLSHSIPQFELLTVEGKAELTLCMSLRRMVEMRYSSTHF